MKSLLIIATTLSIAAASAQGQSSNKRMDPDAAAAPAGWTLVWSDEFDSTSINTSNWTYDLGGGGWGNSELEYYTNRPANATVENGSLLIIGRAESYSGYNYTSARLKSQNLRAFTYGRIEARIKLPASQGLWPAFWMLGSSIAQVGWPKCGEIDIMEHINKVSIVNGTMHWDNNGHVSSGGTTPCDVTQYHVYSVEWDSASIRWLLDGSQYFSGTILNNINSTNEFHAPFFILLNMAIGGNWPGSPDGTTPFPDTMFVDYVRVYEPSLTGVHQGSIEPVDRFALSQNYPNPFNPTTTIRYGIPQRSDVTLTVYTTLGQVIRTLVMKTEEGGVHQVQFDGSGLSSGVYIYGLKAGTYLDAKKMLLVR